MIPMQLQSTLICPRCAHQATDNVVLFQVDPATGRLGATGRSVRVPKAVCVLFLP